MKSSIDLFSRCHVNSNIAGDRFVGIKADTNNTMVHFPIGYELPKEEHNLRKDILHLIFILSEFTEQKNQILPIQEFSKQSSVNFPLSAYMKIINYFMEQKSYYLEYEPKFITNNCGKVYWSKTFKKNKPLIQSNGTPVYTDFTVRMSSPNNNNLITQIHKYCVYESFSKLGWLFTTYLPEKPTISRNYNIFLSVLRTTLANLYNDKHKQLFSAMIAMIQYLDEQPKDKQFYFGTDRFEYVWEKLIDRTFGTKNKYDYFPRTKWKLRTGKQINKSALEPDSIMLLDEKIYVLDAKYYKYGLTGNSNDLPESSSINKQITYGEYIYTQRSAKRKSNDDLPIYNAFIMPYNSKDNVFESNEIYMNIGEATGDWKNSGYKYEKVQGIVVDIRYLMYHYAGNTKNQLMNLAKSIENAFIEPENN